MTAKSLKSISKLLGILGISTFIFWSISGIMDLINKTDPINSLTLTTISFIIILLSSIFLELHKIELRHENDKKGS